jgi:hypothetical protein
MSISRATWPRALPSSDVTLLVCGAGVYPALGLGEAHFDPLAEVVIDA